MARGEVWMSS